MHPRHSPVMNFISYPLTVYAFHGCDCEIPSPITLHSPLFFTLHSSLVFVSSRCTLRKRSLCAEELPFLSSSSSPIPHPPSLLVRRLARFRTLLYFRVPHRRCPANAAHCSLFIFHYSFFIFNVRHLQLCLSTFLPTHSAFFDIIPSVRRCVVKGSALNVSTTALRSKSS